MKILCIAAFTCLLAFQALQPSSAGTAAHQYAITYPSRALSGRVDSLLAPANGDEILALIGRSRSSLPFLPHDTLAVVNSAGMQTITIPPYVTAPGLAASPDGKRLYVLADSMLLTLAGSSTQVVARQDLHLQAIGWPAAISAGPNGDLYLIGQPAGAMEAQAYAFRPNQSGSMRQLWRVGLGLTHAGAWMGLAGTDQLAVYLPDQSDAKGDIALLARSNGALRRSYAVVLAPLAANPAEERLYLVRTGAVLAVDLYSGAPVARVRGAPPLAVSSALGLVAFVRESSLVVARADDVRTVLTIPFPDGLPPTALAWQGSTLLIGTTRGITMMQLKDNQK